MTSAIDDKVPPPPPSNVVPITRDRTRDELRSRRPREVRARTEDLSRITLRERVARRLYVLPSDEKFLEQNRPITRGDCEKGIRPCPFVSCKHNLYLDVDPDNGNIKFNFPDLAPEEVKHSCALDAADNGGLTLEDVGAVMNVTRERVRQIEAKALTRAEKRAPSGFRDFIPPGELTEAKAGHGGHLDDAMPTPPVATVVDELDEDEDLDAPPVRVSFLSTKEEDQPRLSDRLWGMYVKDARANGFMKVAKQAENAAQLIEELTMGTRENGEERRAQLLVAIDTLTKRLGRAPMMPELAVEVGIQGPTPMARKQAVRHALLPVRGEKVDWNRAGVHLLDGVDVPVIRKPNKAKSVTPPRPMPPPRESSVVPVGPEQGGGVFSASGVLVLHRAKLAAEIVRVDKVLGFLADETG